MLVATELTNLKGLTLKGSGLATAILQCKKDMLQMKVQKDLRMRPVIVTSGGGHTIAGFDGSLCGVTHVTHTYERT